jgi:hypothetical protein
MLESNLVRSTTNLIDCYVDEFAVDDGKDEISAIDMRAQLEVFRCLISYYELTK